MTTAKIGIVAPSSKVPMIEFQMGAERIQEAGFQVRVHSQVKKGHWYFAGTDEERARAIWEFAQDPEISVLWCARGGYGAIRLLPHLEKWTQEKGPPAKKLLVGYSDVTALFDFVQKKWGWSVLHAPMPGLRKFCALSREEWKCLQLWIRGEQVGAPLGKKRLKWKGPVPSQGIEGELVGGNLSVLTSLVGTKYFPKWEPGKILFLEDVDEWLYRIDRMAEQLLLSGALNGIQAIVLGNFLHCRDSVSQVLKKSYGKPGSQAFKNMIEKPKASQLEPLRAHLKPDKVIHGIFEQLASHLGVPLAVGLPCGHGPERVPIPMGARVRVSPQGEFSVVDWDWTGVSGERPWV